MDSLDEVNYVFNGNESDVNMYKENVIIQEVFKYVLFITMFCVFNCRFKLYNVHVFGHCIKYIVCIFFNFV